MSNQNDKSFHCELIDPTGKLLDCQVAAVVLPAHDGQIGILYNHMPMLCQLGLGTMRVTPAPVGECRISTPPPRPEASGTGGPTVQSLAEPALSGIEATLLPDVQQNDLFFFIDGGTALVVQNAVTVIAYDALALKDVTAEQLERMIRRTARNLANPDLRAGQRAHEQERLRVLQKIAATLQDM
jgi:F0F1-type ATP synthase epsilon subunit